VSGNKPDNPEIKQTAREKNWHITELCSIR